MVEGVEDSKILRLRLIVQNNRLKEEIERQGYTQKVFAKLVKINWVTLSRIINLRDLPTENQQVAIACALVKPIDYLFPETLLESIKRKVFENRTRLLDEEQVKQISGPPLFLLTDGGIEETEEEVDRDLLKQEMNHAMRTLTKRQKRVIQLRFGLEDGRSRTLKEIGEEFNVTGERIREIEAKALRLLRHPKLSRPLRDFL